jgi:hypothetical protein
MGWGRNFSVRPGKDNSIARFVISPMALQREVAGEEQTSPQRDTSFLVLRSLVRCRTTRIIELLAASIFVKL